ncbi:MAG TPA: hypothetical protein VJC18_06005 [bacterium]|nr:hypothetical protein [bacterium]
MKKLHVFLTDAFGQKKLVGTLAEFDRRIVFEYSNAFLEEHIQMRKH